MKNVMIRCLQPDLMFQHNGSPRFQLDFGKENPQEVSQEVADFLMERHPSNVEIVKKKGEEVKK